MLEIKFTIDATHELIGALRDIAGAIHSISRPMPALQSTQKNSPAERREGTEEDGAAEEAQNLTAETPVEAERPESPENVEGPKKRKSRAKKAPPESNTPVTPTIGDNLSPACACAAPGPSAPEETPAEPEPAPAVADPSSVEGAVSFACVSYVGDRISETPAPEPAPSEEAPAATDEDPLAGKGQTGEILAELTRKAIGDLDALGVDRGDANRRIRDYCARTEIKFPTFPALLQSVGYAEAIAICKGAWK